MWGSKAQTLAGIREKRKVGERGLGEEGERERERERETQREQERKRDREKVREEGRWERGRERQRRELKERGSHLGVTMREVQCTMGSSHILSSVRTLYHPSPPPSHFKSAHHIFRVQEETRADTPAG